MKRVIIASSRSRRVISRSWSDFCKQIEYQLGFAVDAADRGKYSRFITLLKDGIEYEAEVTKYYDGSYELIPGNIAEVEPYDDQYPEDYSY